VFLVGEYGTEFFPKNEFTELTFAFPGGAAQNNCSVDWTNSIALKKYIRHHDPIDADSWDSSDDSVSDSDSE